MQSFFHWTITSNEHIQSFQIKASIRKAILQSKSHWTWIALECQVILEMFLFSEQSIIRWLYTHQIHNLNRLIHVVFRNHLPYLWKINCICKKRMVISLSWIIQKTKADLTKLNIVDEKNYFNVLPKYEVSIISIDTIYIIL